jgi:hypothetical protein
LLWTFRFCTPRAQDILTDTNDCSCLHVDNVVIEAHLTESRDEDVEFFNFRVGVPVAGIFTRLKCVYGETDELVREFVVNHPTSVARGLRAKTAKEFAPLIGRPNVDDFV